MIRFDHTKFTLNIDNNIVKIKAPTYGTEFDIEIISYNLGNFSINGYGKCKLYVYFENPNCISIKLKDNSYIFFNDKSNDETLRYYGELEKAIEK